MIDAIRCHLNRCACLPLLAVLFVGLVPAEAAQVQFPATAPCDSSSCTEPAEIGAERPESVPDEQPCGPEGNDCPAPCCDLFGTFLVAVMPSCNDYVRSQECVFAVQHRAHAGRLDLFELFQPPEPG